MAAKFSREVGLHAAIVLFMCWTNPHTCLGIKKDPRSQFYGHAVIQPSIYTEAREKRDLRSIKSETCDSSSSTVVGFGRVIAKSILEKTPVSSSVASLVKSMRSMAVNRNFNWVVI
ncbi:hypothetical protein NPIL_641451 [Nephila pilipes]|uniref:Uncharacterized protein n=1 Tax=Nephila pilipes TaxID=299642 RepID=A0A8X6MS94_NEPPI|nr:hypothetical protein NPIL_641451 [Nephila pilipes]